MPDAPLLLYYKGDLLSLIDSPTAAVIGTREPTEYGVRLGIRTGEILAENGVTVVSGLALGCDSAGHTGSLNKKGKTVAFSLMD
ncbi:MAG: DNA-processing protein DprA [Ignavibacteriales bacterium]|nr:DNA-processing protein DprA [Ignavibacteriales bacterium]